MEGFLLQVKGLSRLYQNLNRSFFEAYLFYLSFAV
jgi:hypothetical protein